MKLSAKQKEVIVWMRQGCVIKKGITYALVSPGGAHVSTATFHALLDRGIIKLYKRSSRQGVASEYCLSTLGKSIEI